MTLVRSVTLAAIMVMAKAEAQTVTSKLQITLPQSLRKDGGYDHREALFGRPPYGGSIEQNVYYAEADLCDHNVDYSRGGYPTRPDDPDASGKMLQWQSPFILMVDRGGCTFVKKVRNAQKLGAAAVIIADSTCLCSAGEDCVSEGGTFCETKEPIMADDGSGADVTIPSYLMFKQDAEPIKEVIMQDKVIRMQMSWLLPRPDDRVEYSLWTTPKDPHSSPLQQEFKDVAVALGKHAQFSPHMYIYDGVVAGCESLDGENQCYTLCTNSGRYCATDPDDNLEVGISGADVVRESLRRICIWNKYGQDGIGTHYWDYVAEFNFRCDGPSYFMSEDCVKDCMNRAGITYSNIQNCMDDAGGLDGDVENVILEEELIAREADGVVILPSFFVNNAPLRGALTTEEVFGAICAGYMVGSEPSICQKCNGCDSVSTCVKKGHCPGAGIDTVSFPVFAGTLGVVILVFGVLGYIQKQRSETQMQHTVRGIMAEYMPLDKKATAGTVGIAETVDHDLDLSVEIN
jgi:hypothetical protein